MGKGAGRRHRIIPHTADVGIEAHAPSAEELFAEAAVALGEVMARVGREAPAGAEEMVEVAGGDPTSLAFVLLNELVSLADVRHAAVRSLRVDVLRLGRDGSRLRGRVTLLPYGRGVAVRHQVKSVSLHRLSVERRGDAWRLVAYLDL